MFQNDVLLASTNIIFAVYLSLWVCYILYSYFLQTDFCYSTVSIATRYGLDGPGIEFRWGARFSAPVQTGPGAHPASYTMGTGSFPGVKRPGRDVEHPPHLALKLKKE